VTSKNLFFNDDDEENLPDHEDSLLNNVQIGQKKPEHRYAQLMSRATKNNIYGGGGGTYGKLENGIGKSKNGMLRWSSRHDEDTVFNETNHYFGKHVWSNENIFQ
jgi:hypothetical protein